MTHLTLYRYSYCFCILVVGQTLDLGTDKPVPSHSLNLVRCREILSYIDFYSSSLPIYCSFLNCVLQFIPIWIMETKLSKLRLDPRVLSVI